MSVRGLIVALVAVAPAAAAGADRWVPYTSDDGNFVIDFPGKPTKTYTRQARSRTGLVKIIVAQCDTPTVLYTAQKVELPQAAAALKPADMDAILDSWRDDLAAEFNGKVVAQKKVRLDGGATGRDFTIEGRPDPKKGLATVRVREYLSAKVLYVMTTSTAADRDLPDDVGHFFASFYPAAQRPKKAGPRVEPVGKPLGAWGAAVDPDGDCTIREKGAGLEIAVPNTSHDLNAENDKLNAPRVVREATGDFSLTVKVGGTFQPGDKSTNPKAIPYIGGGILVWLDADNYVFLGRAGVSRKGKTSQFAAFEEREWGSRGAVNSGKLEPGDPYLRLERRGSRFLGYTSKDGKAWTKLEPMDLSYPATVKVGLYAINGCTDPVTVVFDEFAFKAQGKAEPKAKPRRID